LTVARGDRHPVDLAMLSGARLVTASETERGRAWAESRIKQITGGDPITARFMNKNPFTFHPTFKLIIIGNHAPTLSTVDEAMRRRFNIVPFTHQPEKPDLDLSRKLRREWPGILRWMLDGCLDWRANRLTRPNVVLQATREYFADQDLLGQWLDRDCFIEIGNRLRWTGSTELYNSWSAFAREADQKPGSKKALVDKLKKRGLTPFRNSEARGFFGITLTEDHGMTDDA
jgi:putative DNA primase/helicase